MKTFFTAGVGGSKQSEKSGIFCLFVVVHTLHRFTPLYGPIQWLNYNARMILAIHQRTRERRGIERGNSSFFTYRGYYTTTAMSRGTKSGICQSPFVVWPCTWVFWKPQLPVTYAVSWIRKTLIWRTSPRSWIFCQNGLVLFPILLLIFIGRVGDLLMNLFLK